MLSAVASVSLTGRENFASPAALRPDVAFGSDGDFVVVSASSVDGDLSEGLVFFLTTTPLRDFLRSFFAGAAAAGLPFPDEDEGVCKTLTGGLLAALSLAATALQDFCSFSALKELL